MEHVVYFYYSALTIVSLFVLEKIQISKRWYMYYEFLAKVSKAFVLYDFLL